MTKSVWIAIAVALLLGGTSLAEAKDHHASKGAPASRPKAGASAIQQPVRPTINESTSNQTTSRLSAPNPYYRLSDQYYDYSDPYRGLYNFLAVPPHVPGYDYGRVRMPPR